MSESQEVLETPESREIIDKMQTLRALRDRYAIESNQEDLDLFSKEVSKFFKENGSTYFKVSSMPYNDRETIATEMHRILKCFSVSGKLAMVIK